MSEGGIYLCDCTRTKGEYALTLRANPDLESSGADLDECMEDLCMQIVEWNGDGEAILELFPPPQGPRVAGGAVLFSAVGYNDGVKTTDYTSLFAGGACPVCKFGIGDRSDAVLRVQKQPKGITCGVNACYPILTIYRNKLIDALTDQERAMFETRPVAVEDGETDYVELIAYETIRTVGYKGADYPAVFQQSFRCKSCGREKFEVDAEGFKPGTKFIDAREVDGSSSSLIMVDDGWRQFPAFRLARWKELLAAGNLRGLLSDPLVALDTDYVEIPKLETCREFDWVF